MAFDPSSANSMQTDAPVPDTLTAEAERLLAGVPETIGDAPLPAQDDTEAAGQPAGDVEASTLTLGAAIVTEGAAASILRGVGETLAGWRKRECYRAAGERAAENCADSLASVLNRAWAQLAPAFMQRIESDWPGMIPLCVGLSFAFGPAVMEDIRETSAERLRVGVTERPINEPKPEPVKPGPVAVETGAGLTGRRVGK